MSDLLSSLTTPRGSELKVGRTRIVRDKRPLATLGFAGPVEGDRYSPGVHTYQVRPRVFRTDNQQLVFPGHATLRLHFAPNAAFGGVVEAGNVVVRGRPAKLAWDANVGRQTAASDPPLEPVDATIEASDMSAHLAGGVLTLARRTASARELSALAATFKYLLPIVLNVGYSEPPVVVMVEGELDGVPFCWELTRFDHDFEVTDQENQEGKFVTAWNRMNLVSAPENRRLSQALHYFHVAARLERTGSSSWEFLAEVLLNLCKVFEVLFPPTGDGHTRDAVRAGLALLGFDRATIESRFIPSMALRDSLLRACLREDVGA